MVDRFYKKHYVSFCYMEKLLGLRDKIVNRDIQGKFLNFRRGLIMNQCYQWHYGTCKMNKVV